MSGIRILPVSPLLCLAVALLVCPSISAAASPFGAGFSDARPAAAPIRPAADAGRARLRAPCEGRGDCPGRRPPGDPDRDARPFAGMLGRPCAYRPRFTPSGTRRVRVCY